MIGTGVKTRYISGVVRDKEAGIRGLPSGTEEFMPLGLGKTHTHTHNITYIHRVTPDSYNHLLKLQVTVEPLQ